MAGLGFDNAFPRVIGSKAHGIIDYIHAGTNIVAGVLFWRNDNKKAAAAAWALGGNVLFNALMTDYDYGVFRKWDFKMHGILDYGVAGMSALFPVVLGLDDAASKGYFYGQGGAETLTAGMTDYDDNSGAEHEQSDWKWEGESFASRVA